MRRVITVNLGGNAFALDEDAYERLRAYVSVTEARLGTSPDRAEILGDLERAVAEHIVANRSTTETAVVSDAVMESALTKIGPVERGDGVDSPQKVGAQSPGHDYTSTSTTSGAESEYTRVVVLLLCVFVGWLGVHRFFVRKVGTGFLQLITLGGLGIWVLIDFILILCGEFKDKDGRRILRWA